MEKPVKDPKAGRRNEAKDQLPHDDREHGEGNYKAAREYDDATREFAKSGKVETAARSARPALEGRSGGNGERRGRGQEPEQGRGSLRPPRCCL